MKLPAASIAVSLRPSPANRFWQYSARALSWNGGAGISAIARCSASVRASSALRSSNILLTAGLSSSLTDAVSTRSIPFTARGLFADEECEIVGDAVEFIDAPRRAMSDLVLQRCICCNQQARQFGAHLAPQELRFTRTFESFPYVDARPRNTAQHGIDKRVRRVILGLLGECGASF